MEMYETKKIFSKNLSNLLSDQKKTQVDVAEALGVSTSTVSSWCTGEKMPRMDKVERLAKYLSVGKSDLLEENKSPVPKREAGDTREWLEDLMVDKGYIKRGEDISDNQAKFLIHLTGLLDAWFDTQRKD